MTSQYWYVAPILFLVLMIIDDGMTYLNIRTLASRYGLGLAAALETNAFVRGSWLRNGMRKGEIRVLLLFLPITLLILAMATVFWIYLPWAFGLGVGVYLFIDARHVNMRLNINDYHPCPQCRTIHRTSPFLLPGNQHGVEVLPEAP